MRYDEIWNTFEEDEDDVTPTEPVQTLAAVPRPTGALERFRARNRARRDAKATMNFSPVCYLATLFWTGFNHQEAVQNANLATTEKKCPKWGIYREVPSGPGDRLLARFAGVVFLALSPIGIVGSTVYVGVKFANRSFNRFWYGE